jgi:hypothetical protein
MEFSVQVDAKEFREGLSRLAKTTKPAERGEAVLSSEGGDLIIRFGGAAVSATMTGQWESVALLSSGFLVDLTPMLPGTGTIEVRAEGKYVRFAGVRTPCRWVVDLSDINLGLNPSTLQLLALAERKTRREIDAAGIAALVRRAEQRRDEAITAAGTALKDLGIQAEHVRQLVQREVLRIAQASTQVANEGGRAAERAATSQSERPYLKGAWESMVGRRLAAVFYNQRESATVLHLCFDDGTGFEIYGQFAGSSRLRFLSVRQARETRERADVPYVAFTDWAPPLDPWLTHSPLYHGTPDPEVVPLPPGFRLPGRVSE